MVMSEEEFIRKNIVIGELGSCNEFVYGTHMILNEYEDKKRVYRDIYLPRNKAGAREEIKKLANKYKEIYGEDF